MKRKRWLWRALVAVVLLVIVLLLAARFYLRSSAVASRLAAELANTLGVPVRVEEADVGLFGESTARNVTVHESESDEDRPWLSVDEVSADVSVLDLLRGKATPGRVTVRGARAELRFDAAGNLLTRLPEFGKREPTRPVPVVRPSASRTPASCCDRRGGPRWSSPGSTCASKTPAASRS
jgi:hypothetical protein